MLQFFLKRKENSIEKYEIQNNKATNQIWKINKTVYKEKYRKVRKKDTEKEKKNEKMLTTQHTKDAGRPCRKWPK